MAKAAIAAISDAGISGNASDSEYTDYLARVQKRFETNTKNGAEPLFTTDAAGLFDAYLNALPESQRPFHRCHACRQFIERFGGLVTIDEKGVTSSVLWDTDDAPVLYQFLYQASTRALRDLVRKAKVTGVFLCKEAVWGAPVTGDWVHLAVRPDKALVFRHAVLTAGQAMAEKREDYKTVSVALGEYTLPVIETAIRLLESDSLYRSEKVLGQATWLRDLHIARKSAANGCGANVVWRAVATAPAGFCHPRSSMIGTLLDDIAAGKSFDDVSRAFASKMHPLRYQRPQAAPSAGNIAQAEKIVASLNAAGSLERRFCRLDEIKALWTPRRAAEEGGDASARTGGGRGVFGHLTPKGPSSSALPAMELPPAVMTWEKFERTVLPAADAIELFTKSSDNYCVLVTAVHPDSTPILQWDMEDARNPVSWYVWHGGSPSAQFGLPAGAWVRVEAVTYKPSMWCGSSGGAFAHQGDGVIFALTGAKETRQCGSAIFPETLRSEFYGIRSVIEAYSRSAKIADAEPQVIGPLLQKGQRWSTRVRVTTKGQKAIYDLDRWD